MGTIGLSGMQLRHRKRKILMLASDVHFQYLLRHVQLRLGVITTAIRRHELAPGISGLQDLHLTIRPTCA